MDQAERNEANSGAAGMEQGGEPFEEAQAIDAEPHAEGENARAAVVWRPEDAANFLAKAIRESQKPLAEALARPSVPVHVLWLVVLALLVLGGGIYFQLYKTENKLEKVDSGEERRERQERENVLRMNYVRDTERLKTKLSETETRAAALQQEVDKRRETEREFDRARNTATMLGAEVSRLRADLADKEKAVRELDGVRQENSRLRSAAQMVQEQIDAQAEEVAALRKQLESARRVSRVLSGEEPPAANPAEAPARPEAVNAKKSAENAAAPAAATEPAKNQTVQDKPDEAPNATPKTPAAVQNGEANAAAEQPAAAPANGK